MNPMPQVTVCGCGSGGLAMAADLAMMGCPVVLYEIAELAENLDPIRENGGITLTGRPLSQRTGLAPLRRITADPQEAVAGSELIFVNVPAMPVVEFMARLEPHLTAGQTVVVTTGYWAALRTRHALGESDLFRRCTIVEQNIMPYLSEKVGPAEAHVSNVKDYFRIAALPAAKNDAAYAALAPVYPQAQVSQNVLENNLQPGNPGVHAQITLPKAAFFFDRARVFRFYAEVSPSAAKLAEAFDRERMAVAQALDCRTTTWVEYCRRAYGYAGDDLYAMHIHSPHAERWSTDAEARRLLVEDLCYFFVPLEQLAAVTGVAVPVTTAMIELLTVLSDFNYREHALTLADLGLEGLNREQILDTV